ncbi:hypothetical protein T492DRAFT_910689 [Pavlovales sp. CCMP2436]|nr:hypothetical protein T492DRAFT_910689 [Pavlovales sp. CCMP2436]
MPDFGGRDRELSEAGGSLLARFWADDPGATALLWHPSRSDRPTAWTYAQLWAHAARIGAALLAEHGARAGDRVGVAIAEGPELVLVAVALLAHGLVLVPLEADECPVERMRFMLEDAMPALVVATGGGASSWHLHATLRAAGAAHVVDAQWLCFGRGGAVGPMAAPTGSLDATLAALIAAEPPGDSECHIFFTSGSTGRPKGCVVHRSALTAYCTANVQAHDLRGPPEVVFVASPHTFDPSLGDIASTLCTGAAIALAPRSDIAASLGSCLARAHATHVTTTPTAWRAVDAEHPPPQLRVVALGGEPMPTALVEAWLRRVRLLNTYGTTECCVYQAISEVDSPADARMLGEPFAGTRFLVAAGDGSDWRVRVQEGSGEEGELWLGGPQVGRGYAGDRDAVARESERRFFPVAEAEQAHAGGPMVFRTGDIVLDSPRGWQLRGRRDGQVKVRGRRLELSEVEAAIERVAVDLVSAVGAYLDGGGRLVVWCKLRECGGCGEGVGGGGGGGGGGDEEERPSGGGEGEGEDSDSVLTTSACGRVTRATLRLLCGTVLAEWAIPSKIALTVRPLSTTASGKLDRRSLQAWPLPSPSLLPYRLARIYAGNSLTEIPLDGPRTGEVSAVDSVVDAQSAVGPRADLKARADGARACAGALPPDPSASLDGDALEPTVGETRRFAEAAALARQAATAGAVKALRALVCLLIDECSTTGNATTGAAKGTAVAARGSESERAVGAALRAACTAGKVECANACLLLSPGAARMSGPQGDCALHAAARAPSAQVVPLILAAGASLADLDHHGQSALHYAARAGASARVLDALAKAAGAGGCKKPGRGRAGGRGGRKGGGAAVGHDVAAAVERAANAQDKWGRSPLHWAAVHGHAHAVEWLLAAGASRAVADQAGETALLMAERRALCSAADRGGEGPPARWSSVAKALGGAGTTRALRASAK